MLTPRVGPDDPFAEIDAEGAARVSEHQHAVAGYREAGLAV